MYYTAIPNGWRTSVDNYLHDAAILRRRYVLPFSYAEIAHVHHAYEHHLHHSYPLGIILISSLVQFTYTTLFGWYASYIFLSTQTIWAPIVVHAFCNIMGLPRFFGQIPGVPLWKTYVYYLCLVLGATGFGVGVGSIKPADLHL